MRKASAKKGRKKKVGLSRLLKGYLPATVLCVLAFVSGIPVGYVFYSDLSPYLMPVLEQLQELAEGKSDLEMMIFIFLNNYRVSLLLMAMGVMVFPALFVLLGNGMIMGFLLKYILEAELGLGYFVRGITAHGIFELPAIFLSGALGMRVGWTILVAVVSTVFEILEGKKTDFGARIGDIKRSIKEAIVVHFAVVLPLLVIAAFVESYVTPLLLQ